MMPGNPVPTLRIGQARLTLRPLEALLDGSAILPSKVELGIDPHRVESVPG